MQPITDVIPLLRAGMTLRVKKQAFAVYSITFVKLGGNRCYLSLLAYYLLTESFIPYFKQCRGRRASCRR